MDVFLLKANVPVGLDRVKVFSDYRFTEEESLAVFNELAEQLGIPPEDIPYTITPEVIPTEPEELLKFINLLLVETIH